MLNALQKCNHKSFVYYYNLLTFYKKLHFAVSFFIYFSSCSCIHLKLSYVACGKKLPNSWLVGCLLASTKNFFYSFRILFFVAVFFLIKRGKINIKRNFIFSGTKENISLFLSSHLQRTWNFSLIFWCFFFGKIMAAFSFIIKSRITKEKK